MAADYIPDGFTSVTPYLTVHNAAGLIAFLKEAFGAEEIARYPRPDGGIMHAQVRIGDSMLEISDATSQFPPTTAALHLYVPSVDEAHKKAVAAGAASVMEPADQEYGERSSFVRDVFGNNWYIATHTGNAAG